MRSTVWAWPGREIAKLAGHGTEWVVRGESPCPECGLPHPYERRAAVLRRMLPATSGEILAAWPHLWPDQRNLARDLNRLGAIRPRTTGEEWRLP